MQFSRLWLSHYYTSINNVQTPYKHEAFSNSFPLARVIIAASLAFFWTGSIASSGFYLGKLSTSSPSSITQNLELDLRSTSFVYNRTYSDVPSAATNQLWKDIFPSKNPFFVHPTISPEMAVHSVWHQVHCLDAIRHAYWNVYQIANGSEIIPNNSSLADLAKEAHVRHCIDLLRQSLICHADTTVEVVDPKLRGVSGFGVDHQCRDWGQLMQWTIKWHFE